MNNIVGWIDEQLGRITMYSLVFYSLVVMVATAFVLMITGSIGFSPMWFAASVATCVGVAYGSNYLFGWLFGVKPHNESAWITGLILSLLFLPPTTVVGLVKIALVVMIAMASKYVIAIRNRHIFNPAAIAIVIASFGGLAYAGWWVATPPMIPVTLVAGVLILRRTKMYNMSGIFVVVAALSLLIQGTDPITALTSWPLLFIGAIMLTEPLTLPPRARQQYIMAAVVALLMTVSFTYGRITMTPALALVVGNLIGWWYGRRQSLRLRFTGKKQLNVSTFEFMFDSPKLDFEPGQYLELSLIHPHSDIRGHRRIFSIASKPGEEQIVIGTRVPAKSSSFKRALMSLKPGTMVYATRIAGDFVLPKDPTEPIVCIAGGIGITPFISFCESADRPMKLIYAVSSLSDLSFVDVLKQHAINVVVVSPDDGKLPDADWTHEKGRLDDAMLKKLIDVNKQPTVYVSGPPAMVMNVRSMVKSLGVKRVKVDEFSGY